MTAKPHASRRGPKSGPDLFDSGPEFFTTGFMLTGDLKFEEKGRSN